MFALTDPLSQCVTVFSRFFRFSPSLGSMIYSEQGCFYFAAVDQRLRWDDMKTTRNEKNCDIPIFTELFLAN